MTDMIVVNRDLIVDDCMWVPMIIMNHIDVVNSSHLPGSGDFVCVDLIILQDSEEAFSSRVVPTLEDIGFVNDT